MTCRAEKTLKLIKINQTKSSLTNHENGDTLYNLWKIIQKTNLNFFRINFKILLINYIKLNGSKSNTLVKKHKTGKRKKYD